MWSAWLYGLLFTGIIALNHKFGKPYEDHKIRRKEQKERRKARYDKHREEERASLNKYKEKCREARRKEREEEERLRLARGRGRKWVYGVNDEYD